jgi:hypothetical protein
MLIVAHKAASQIMFGKRCDIFWHSIKLFYKNLLFVELLANIGIYLSCVSVMLKSKEMGGDLHPQHFMLRCRMHGDIASCSPYACVRVADTNAVGVSVLILEISLFLSF